jgi:hypothetical protein
MIIRNYILRIYVELDSYVNNIDRQLLRISSRSSELSIGLSVRRLTLLDGHRYLSTDKECQNYYDCPVYCQQTSPLPTREPAPYGKASAENDTCLFTRIISALDRFPFFQGLSVPKRARLARIFRQPDPIDR